MINKGLGRFVLTHGFLSLALRHLLCEGKKVRTTIKCASFLLLPGVPSPFFCASQSLHPGRLNSDPTFTLKPPLPRAASQPPAPCLSAKFNQHTGCCLVKLFLNFSETFKRNIDHSLFMCVCSISPSGFEGHSPLI